MNCLLHFISYYIYSMKYGKSTVAKKKTKKNKKKKMVKKYGK